VRDTLGTTGRSANPMPFPRLPQGDTISLMSRRVSVLHDLLLICYGAILKLEDCR
jgi:hypothetical protein